MKGPHILYWSCTKTTFHIQFSSFQHFRLPGVSQAPGSNHWFSMKVECKTGRSKGPLISLCQIISVECPTNLNFPLLTSNQNKGSPKQPISMKPESKFVGHSTEIIRQSKIKGPLIHKYTVKHLHLCQSIDFFISIISILLCKVITVLNGVIFIEA